MTEIKNERDYSIRKGKILERFSEQFFEKYMHNALYRNVYESLIRDADPYEIIEKLIEINDEQYQKILELVTLMPVGVIKNDVTEKVLRKEIDKM